MLQPITAIHDRKLPTTTNCWNEFCSETSLAGFKYLLPNIHPLRRLCWYAVCTAFIVLTGYQLLQLFIGYAKNPIKITVEKKYPRSLVFPEIVVCNTMSFRVSAVRPYNDMHKILTEIYRSPKLQPWNATERPDVQLVLEQINDTRQYYEMVAHQKSDMIISCRWQNESCSADNFTVTITEVGICYSFNKDYRNALTVSNSGKDSGLQLVLNVATYEEMNGPHSELGILVAFFPQDTPPSAERAVNTLIGGFTSISLTQKQVNFLDGLNCRKKNLKYFGKYTRDACTIERTFEVINQTCGCYPYSLPVTKESADLIRCNMAEELSCAELTLRERPDFSDEACPRECTVHIYTPIVSTSKVAWERLETTFERPEETRLNVSRQLKRAWEISKRHFPKYSETTTALLKRMLNATANVTHLVEVQRYNVSSVEFPPLITGGSAPAFAESLESFRLRFQSASFVELERSLGELSRAANISEAAFGHSFTLSYLHGERQVNGSLEERYWLPETVFSVVSNVVFVVNLPAVLQSLATMDKTKLALDRSIYEAFHTASEMTLLTEEQQSLLGNITTALMLIGRNSQQSNETGCLEEKFGRHPLLDVFLCFLHNFTSPSSQLTMAREMAQLTKAIDKNTFEPRQQSRTCTRLLCSHIKHVDSDNCSMSAWELGEFSGLLHSTLRSAINTCRRSLQENKVELDKFVKTYMKGPLKEYSEAVSTVTGFMKNYAKIQDFLHRKLFDDNTPFAYITSNITTYMNENCTYEQLAQRLIRSYANWLDQTFNYNVNSFKESLATVVDTLDSAELQLRRILNGSSADGIYQVVTGSLLWRNNSIANLQSSLDATELLRGLSAPLIPELQSVGDRFDAALTQLLTDATDFLEKIVVGPNFYENNFMVVNVHMQEISTEVVSQENAINFWNLIADLGGAASFWLGLCMITLAELVDVSIRHGFKCCRSALSQIFRCFCTNSPTASGSGQSSRSSPVETDRHGHNDNTSGYRLTDYNLSEIGRIPVAIQLGLNEQITPAEKLRRLRILRNFASGRQDSGYEDGDCRNE